MYRRRLEFVNKGLGKRCGFSCPGFFLVATMAAARGYKDVRIHEGRLGVYMTHCYLRRAPRAAAALGVLALALGMASPADAIPIITDATWSGSSGNLSASARFQLDTALNRLTITLTNTSMNDVLSPEDVLTTVFFGLSPAYALTPLEAYVPSGSEVMYPTFNSPPSGIHLGSMAGTYTRYGTAGPTGPIRQLNSVATEWAYSYDPGPTLDGIGSSGLGIFGPSDRFDTTGPNLAGPEAPDGLQYGITSADDNPLTGNQAVRGGSSGNRAPLIRNSVVFTFGTPSGFTSLATDWSNWVIRDLQFQYGTSLSETRFRPDPPPVPEPMTIIMLGCLGAGMLGARQVRRLRAGKE